MSGRRKGRLYQKVVIRERVWALDQIVGSMTRLAEADLVIGLEGNRAHILKDRYGEVRTVPRATAMRMAEGAARA